MSRGDGGLNRVFAHSHARGPFSRPGAPFWRTVVISSYIQNRRNAISARDVKRNAERVATPDKNSLARLRHAPWPRFHARLITAITAKIPTRVHGASRRFNHRFNGAFAVHLLAGVPEPRGA